MADALIVEVHVEELNRSVDTSETHVVCCDCLAHHKVFVRPDGSMWRYRCACKPLKEKKEEVPNGQS